MISYLKKILNTSGHSRSKRVYLDNAGATEMSRSARSALLESLSTYGNPSGIHKEGVEAGLLLDKARAMCAIALNAHAYEIYFVGSGTESCNLAVMGTYQAFATSAKLPHMIVSSIEHPAVLEPVQQLEREGKIRVTYLPVYKNGIVKVQDMREALTEDTILVSIMYANNEIGTLQPVKEIGRAIEEWKRELGRPHTGYPYFHVDACQAANYCNLDVVRLRSHLMTVNSSKVYGPKGVALLYKREGVSISPTTLGGGQERGLRSGTESVPSAYAFATALEDVQKIKEEESIRLRELRDYCKVELTKVIPSVTFYGAWDEAKDILRLPNNINCRIPGISSEEMIIRLDAKGVAVSHKSACASQVEDGSYVIKALGATDIEANENIRISLGRYTTRKDIQKLVKEIKVIYIQYSTKNL